jgi:hypothetical protein
MKLVLRITIQGFWAFLGGMSLWMLTEMCWRMISGHFPIGVFQWMLLFPILLLLGALVLGAWSALFRFSQGLLGPVVFIVTLVLFNVAMWGITHDLTPMMQHDIKSHAFSLMPFISLLVLFVVVVGAFKFYRVTLGAITVVLFPELRHSAARFV